MAKDKGLLGLRFNADSPEPYTWEPIVFEYRGLAIYRVPRRRGKFCIAHVASGTRAVARTYYSKEAALLALGRLTLELDWRCDYATTQTAPFTGGATAEAGRPGAPWATD